MKIHFIAIGGSAMHNLAIALSRKGFEVSGSDDATVGTLEEVSLGSLDEGDTADVDTVSGIDNVQQTEGTTSEDTVENAEVVNNDAEVEESTDVNEQ